MKIGNLEVYGIIYKITNLANEQVYIGQTISKNGFKGRYQYSGQGIERIYRYHEYQKEKNRFHNNLLYNSIKKYGVNNFKVDEIFDIAFSKEELDIKEKTYINLYNSIDNGYNFRDGGANGKFSEKSIKKMKISSFGKKASKEAKLKMSKSHRGKITGPRKPLSEEVKKKIVINS